MDNNDGICQCCRSYVITIIYFQNTAYKFGLGIFRQATVAGLLIYIIMNN